MKTRSVLLYVPGIPLRAESLLPQRRLAAVAGALLSKGHFTSIIDHGTVEAVRRCTPPGLTTVAQQAAQELESKTPRLLPGFLTGFFQTRGFEVLLNEFQEGRRREIGGEVAACQPLDFVAILALDRSDLREALLVSESLRQRFPEMKQVVFGPCVDVFGSMILSLEEAFDGAFTGDAEMSLPQWAEWGRHPGEWPGVPNLLYRCDHQVVETTRDASTSLDRFPAPCYDEEIYPAAHAMGKFKLFTLEQSCGCTHVSHQESDPSSIRRTLRTRSTALLCGEMAGLGKQFGARAFHIEGKHTAPAQAEQLARDIKSRGLTVQYSRDAHIRHMAPASLPLLAASGCVSAAFQIDTGSQRLLEDFYGHEFGVTEMERVLAACRKAGVFTVAGIAYPCPQDDYHTRAETLRVLSRCHPNAAPLSMPLLLPGSAWMQSAPAFGFKVDHAAYARWALGHESNASWGDRAMADLPYRMTGWTRSRIASEYADLTRDIEELHILARATAREGLLARMSGYEGEEGLYCAMMRRRLFTMDTRGLMKLAGEFNGRATAPMNLVAFRPFTPVLAAVGN